MGARTLNVTAVSATPPLSHCHAWLPGDTIDSAQLLARHHTRCTLNYSAEARRQAGREARMERGRMEDGMEGGWEGVGREGGREVGSKGRVGEEQRDGVRKR